jgi:dihydroorotate dehydrogenase electron transfer subunit
LDLRTLDVLRPTSIERVVSESSNVRSLYFRDDESSSAEPGQFIMVWLPEIGEFPMSLSLNSDKLSSIGVKAMGEGSKRLYEAKVGTKLGVRGPYGESFNLRDQSRAGNSNLLLAGGGTGLVPMVVLAKALSNTRNVQASAVVSARTKAEIPFLRAFNSFLGSDNVHVTTDDGSKGFKGLGHEKVQELVRRSKRIDGIFACGPERMLAQIYKIATEAQVPIQLSLERIMKCGMGICGSCSIGDRVLCRDGPVLDATALAAVRNEFGHAFRDKTGKLSPSS